MAASISSQPELSSAVPRIAWLGPSPSDNGGVPEMAGQMVLGLAEAGIDIEMFLEDGDTPLIERLAQHDRISVHPHPTHWNFDRWYSSTNLTKLVTGTAARVRTQRRVVDSLVRRHAERPFTAVYRFSQPELFKLRKALPKLPPLIVHPEVHATGERRHHWRERNLARMTEGAMLFAVNHAYLGYRSALQIRDMHIPQRVITPSEHLATDLHDDYGIPYERLRVLPNVIDLDRFSPAPIPVPTDPVRVLFVSRMSVRKGVEQVVALSHRLNDLAGRVWIQCIGGGTLFSDYRPLLDNLNRKVGEYQGYVTAAELPTIYRHAHMVIQPSWYEPFANTVAEALASGLPTLVSSEVGAAEGVCREVCRIHPAGDLDALEDGVRNLVRELEQGAGPDLSSIARREAVVRFGRSTFAIGFLDVLNEMRAELNSEG